MSSSSRGSALSLVVQGLLTLLILVALGLGLRHQFAIEPGRTAGMIAPRGKGWSAQLVSWRGRRIANALGVYRQRTGGYPDTLDVLLSEGLLGAEDLRSSHGSDPFFYRRLGAERYQLLPPLR